jgi:shikimate dehydrogenase
MTVSGKTKICALIGDPVEHTMSPPMHNAAFRQLGLDYIYVPFRVKPEDLAAVVAGFKALNVRGFNVTIPHKVTVTSLLDTLDPLAEKIGAVNTVVNDNGKLTGYNTDATGFLQALLQQGMEPDGKNVVILGAGGASRAISYILAENGAGLTILNRLQELDWAVDLAHRISEDFGKEVRALELTRENLTNVLAGAAILINATSVGMTPDEGASPVPADLLRPELVVFDIVYNPIRTVGGIDMLAWQGALAFEKWTGQQAPLDLMRREVVKAMERYED